MTTTILERIDPSALPERTTTLLELLGPSLAAGLDYAATGKRLGRSQDWVAEHVRELRSAIADQVLAAGEGLDPELRARLEVFAAGRVPG